MQHVCIIKYLSAVDFVVVVCTLSSGEAVPTRLQNSLGLSARYILSLRNESPQFFITASSDIT